MPLFQLLVTSLGIETSGMFGSKRATAGSILSSDRGVRGSQVI